MWVPWPQGPQSVLAVERHFICDFSGAFAHFCFSAWKLGEHGCARPPADGGLPGRDGVSFMFAHPEPGTPEVLGRWLRGRPCRALGATYVLTVDISLAGAAEELPPQEIPVVLQEGQVEVAEKLHVLVLHPQLLGGVPVNDLAG